MEEMRKEAQTSRLQRQAIGHRARLSSKLPRAHGHLAEGAGVLPRLVQYLMVKGSELGCPRGLATLAWHTQISSHATPHSVPTASRCFTPGPLHRLFPVLGSGFPTDLFTLDWLYRSLARLLHTHLSSCDIGPPTGLGLDGPPHGAETHRLAYSCVPAAQPGTQHQHWRRLSFAHTVATHLNHSECCRSGGFSRHEHKGQPGPGGTPRQDSKVEPHSGEQMNTKRGFLGPSI